MRHLIGLKEPQRDRCGTVISASGKRTSERGLMMRRFGVMYQSGALWSSLTLAENISLALELYTDLKPARIREVASLKLLWLDLPDLKTTIPAR